MTYNAFRWTTHIGLCSTGTSIPLSSLMTWVKKIKRLMPSRHMFLEKLNLAMGLRQQGRRKGRWGRRGQTRRKTGNAGRNVKEQLVKGRGGQGDRKEGVEGVVRGVGGGGGEGLRTHKHQQQEGQEH